MSFESLYRILYVFVFSCLFLFGTSISISLTVCMCVYSHYVVGMVRIDMCVGWDSVRLLLLYLVPEENETKSIHKL